MVDHGWVIDREFGHLTHGYVVTSHASQGATVDKVFIGLSSDSFPATNERTGYVAVTRAKEQALIFTDDKDGLLKVMSRPDDPMSATQLAESTNGKSTVRDRHAKHLTTGQQLAAVAHQHHLMQQANTRKQPERGLDHER